MEKGHARREELEQILVEQDESKYDGVRFGGARLDGLLIYSYCTAVSRRPTYYLIYLQVMILAKRDIEKAVAGA
jgi:hypothetical protein